jgi:preprotein translocase subunit SecF
MSTAAIRGALQRGGIEGPEIQTFGATNEFVIRARLQAGTGNNQSTQETTTAVETALTEAFGVERYETVRTEAVGPKVGGELRQKAMLAILLSFGVTLLYLAFRFEWRFGVAAVAATVHDIVAGVAFIALMNLEVSLVVVAAVLTIVGYSLNDTIVVFDRVRENLRKYKRENLYAILNRSVNETLPRTLLTGVTTLAATVALLIFGGRVIHGFAWIMTFGIIIGTFSSIYIASPVLLAIEHRWPGEDARGAKSILPRGATVSG